MNYISNYTLFKNRPIKEEVNTNIFESNFYFDPNDIFYTFCSLTHKTYPYGKEQDSLRYINMPLQKDSFNNYFIKIGESNTMFTSHLDSFVSETESQKVKLITFEKENAKFVSTDGNTILGADDKAGVTIMLYMIENKIPGLYYFFIGEEKGGLGSKALAESPENLSGINKCISFDRRGYNSVITKQKKEFCCSNIFADSLCEQLNKNGLSYKRDESGIFTDSANFMGLINECTNISVGYFKEHSKKEYQNITYLEKLCKACVKIDWDNLPSIKK